MRDDWKNRTVELLAPDFFPLECAPALTRAERRGIISIVEGVKHLIDLLASLPQQHPALPLLPRAYEISSAKRIGFYDCLYVALAEQHGCELVTADEKLVANLRSDFPFVLSLSSMP